MTTYIEDPLYVRINPGTTEGLKSYLKAIADRTMKEKYTQSNVKAAMLMFKSDAHDFSWEELVHRVTNDDIGTLFQAF